MTSPTVSPGQRTTASATSVRVLVADDQPVMLAGVVATLSEARRISVVGRTGCVDECLALVESTCPDIVVTDMRLGGADAIEACELVRSSHPDVGVVVLTGFADEWGLARAFAAGAGGFVAKTSGPERLAEAVATVASGRAFIDPKLAGTLVTLAGRGARATGPHQLTMQEMRVLEELPRGLSNRQIARALGISANTVKTRLRHALTKLGAANRAQAAARAIQEGLAS